MHPLLQSKGKRRRTGELRVCEICQVEMYVRPYELNSRRFCSKPCADKSKRLAGPGSRFKRRSDGYVMVYYPTHPNAYASSGMVPEHRLVAERKVGRALLRSEHVHHINGIRHDNRPENLEVINEVEHQLESSKQGVTKRRKIMAELEEYRRKFGPLETRYGCY